MNDKNPFIIIDPFDSDPELKALDQKLTKALAAETCPDLAEQIFQETLEDLKLVKLDQLLQKALAVPAPAELSPRCYQASAEEMELQQLSGTLVQALSVDSPEGLSDAVFAASLEGQQLGSLETQLHKGLAAQSPSGLSDPIYLSTQEAYAQAHDAPAVIGQINRFSSARFWLRAAVIVFGISVGSWFIVESFRDQTFEHSPDPTAEINFETLNDATSTALSSPELNQNLNHIDDQLDKVNDAIHTDHSDSADLDDDLFSTLNDIKE